MPITLKALKPKEADFEPQTLGEHIRKRRLELWLTQRQLGDRLGVSSNTVLNWERGHTDAPFQCIPAILGFLGYDPFPVASGLPEHMLSKRRVMGWSIAKAARHLGVDEGTWAAWERGETILFREHRARIARFLGLHAEAVHGEMAARWNRSHQEASNKKS